MRWIFLEWRKYKHCKLPYNHSRWVSPNKDTTLTLLTCSRPAIAIGRVVPPYFPHPPSCHPHSPHPPPRVLPCSTHSPHVFLPPFIHCVLNFRNKILLSLILFISSKYRIKIYNILMAYKGTIISVLAFYLFYYCFYN